MGYAIRVSLPGYNALTDTNPDHYALYSDENWVLIKEKIRGGISVGASTTQSIYHGLGYVPFFMIYVGVGSEKKYIYGYNIYLPFRAWGDLNYIYLQNRDSVSRTFYYYIFYDQQV